MPAKRRILKAQVRFISLCPRGKNQFQTIYKSEDAAGADTETQLLVKEGMSEQGEILAIVWKPNTPDIDGDVADEAVVKDMMYEAARNGFDVDIRHDEKVVGKDKAFVAQTFIVQKDDPRFAGLKDYDGNAVDPTGSWGVVIKIDDPELRKRYRDKEWNGVSMGGRAKFEPVTKESETDMTAEQIAALTQGIISGVSAGVKAAIDPLAKQVEDLKKAVETGTVKKEAPKPGAAKPITSAFELRKASLVARRAKLTEDLDLTDADAVEAVSKEVEEIDAQLVELNKEDRKNAASRAPSGNGKGEDKSKGGYFEGISKSDEDAEVVNLGRGMANYANAQRGFAKSN